VCCNPCALNQLGNTLDKRENIRESLEVETRIVFLYPFIFKDCGN